MREVANHPRVAWLISAESRADTSLRGDIVSEHEAQRISERAGFASGWSFRFAYDDAARPVRRNQ
jgi:hypothetical protein